MEEPQGSEMEHAVSTLHGGVKNVSVQDVAAQSKYPDPRILQCFGQVFFGPAREVVVDPDFRDVLLSQGVRCMRADQARTADEQESLSSQLHHVTPARSSTKREKGNALVKAGDTALRMCMDRGPCSRTKSITSSCFLESTS